MLFTPRGSGRAAVGVRAVAGGLGIALIAGSASAGMMGTIVLDTFDDPNVGALGQDRNLSDAVVSNPSGTSFPVFTEVLTGPTVYSFQSGPQVEATGTIEYPFESLNAAALGIIGFEFDIESLDQAFEFSITLVSGPGTGSASASTSVGSIGTATIGLGEFVTDGMFALTDITSVQLDFNTGDPATPALDFTLGEFRAQIPTPGALGVLGAGGLLAARRRRRC